MFDHYDDMQTFDSLYQQHIGQCKRNKDAYQKVERKYKDRFGKRRYSSFQSFKVAYSRRHKG